MSKQVLWNKSHKPWVTFNTYFDKENGLEIPAEEVPGNYVIIKIEKNVTTTKTNRIIKRTIECRKLRYKQGDLFESKLV